MIRADSKKLKAESFFSDIADLAHHAEIKAF